MILGNMFNDISIGKIFLKGILVSQDKWSTVHKCHLIKSDGFYTTKDG